MPREIPRMSRVRRRELIRTGRRYGDAATAVRFHIVAELAAERSRNEVARRLSVSVSTVVKIADRYVEMGVAGLFDQRSANGPTKVDEAFLNELRAILVQTPPAFGWIRPTWTRELLCKEMQSRNFPSVSVCTMGRALHSIGARLGRAKPIVLCPWPAEEREKRLKQLRRLASRSSVDEPVYFEDEVDIDFNPRIGRDWVLPGGRRFVVTPGQNQKHYIAGALNAKTRRLFWVEHPTKNSVLFCKLLWLLVRSHRRARRIHLILDNYIIHKSGYTQRVLDALGERVCLHFLPPYCPDDNRIERVWLDLHDNVTRNHQCPTFFELAGNVAGFLDGYDAGKTESSAAKSQLKKAA